MPSLKLIGDPILREVSQEVTDEEFVDGTVANLLDEMKEVLNTTQNGVAIAAPQVGYAKRIFIIAEHILDEESVATSYSTYINPQIKKQSRATEWLEEGCLSVPNTFGEVKRSVKTTVRAQNEEGEWFENGASGLRAQIYQHETDHLDGILFVDKARNIREVFDTGNRGL